MEAVSKWHGVEAGRIDIERELKYAQYESLQIAQSMSLDTFKGCYLNYKLYDPLSHKYFDSPNVW